jgi:hypothetical protein
VAAQQLAEKHLHFPTLVRLCFADQPFAQFSAFLEEDDKRTGVGTFELTSSGSELLEKYMDDFQSADFPAFVTEWELQVGRLQSILTHKSLHDVVVATALQPHPQLAWIHSLGMGNTPIGGDSW